MNSTNFMLLTQIKMNSMNNCQFFLTFIITVRGDLVIARHGRQKPSYATAGTMRKREGWKW